MLVISSIRNPKSIWKPIVSKKSIHPIPIQRPMNPESTPNNNPIIGPWSHHLIFQELIPIVKPISVRTRIIVTIPGKGWICPKG